MAPSLFSEVVSKGKKNFSFEKAISIAEKLELEGIERDYFCLLVQYQSATTPRTRQEHFERLQSIRPKRVVDLSLDVFTAISSWYHIPILVMTELGAKEFTPERISERLGISPVEARAAIERLERLELLKKDDKGHYQRIHEYSLFESKMAHEGLRKFHRQMLEKAMASIETQTPKEKVIGSETFAIDIAQIPDAQKRIRKFMGELVDLFDKGKKKPRCTTSMFNCFE